MRCGPWNSETGNTIRDMGLYFHSKCLYLVRAELDYARPFEKMTVFQYQYMTMRECSHAVKVNLITHKGLKTKHSMFIYFRALTKRDLVTIWAQTIKFIFPFLMYRIVNIGIVNASSKFEISSNKQETEFKKKILSKSSSFYCLLNYIIIWLYYV